MSKQDRQGARTPADLERKYNFGENFAEIMGIATDARTTAEEAKKETENIVSKLTHEEIFNLLTNNGKNQGIFKDPNGEIYINAEFIKSIEKLFAKDLLMTGKFTNTFETFIRPGQAEIDTIAAELQSPGLISSTLIPLYDVNNDGKITTSDMANFRLAMLGKLDLEKYLSSAKKTPVTLTIDLSNPEKFLRITGTNMWGRAIDEYVGLYDTSIKNNATIDQMTADKILYEDTGLYMSGGHTIRLSEPVSKQNKGIVLAWSGFENGAAINGDWHYTFVPKHHISAYEGSGISSGLMVSSTMNTVGHKYVYVSDTTINGNDENKSADTKNGITRNNAYWVLRYVFGV